MENKKLSTLPNKVFDSLLLTLNVLSTRWNVLRNINRLKKTIIESKYFEPNWLKLFKQSWKIVCKLITVKVLRVRQDFCLWINQESCDFFGVYHISWNSTIHRHLFATDDKFLKWENKKNSFPILSIFIFGCHTDFW